VSGDLTHSGSFGQAGNHSFSASIENKAQFEKAYFTLVTIGFGLTHATTQAVVRDDQDLVYGD
jgi:hypothetical protein